MYKGFISSSILPRLWCGTLNFYAKDTPPTVRCVTRSMERTKPLSLAALDSSPNRGALGKTGNSILLPKPPLQGEVALRSNDGEVVRRIRFSRAARVSFGKELCRGELPLRADPFPFWRHRVIPPAAQRVAPGDPPCAQQQALAAAVGLDGLHAYTGCMRG